MIGERLVTGFVAGLARLISGARPVLSGWEPSPRPAIYYANHGSHLDAVVIWAMLPPEMRRRTHPAAARDYWEKSRLRRWLAQHVFKAILIDRRGAHGIAASIEAMCETLAQGDSLILFPEGTRGDGLDVGPFKPGLYHLAQRCPEVDLVPVYLQNLNRILPKGEFLPVPFLSSASFAAPIRLTEQEEREAFLTRARDAILAQMEERSC